MKSLSREFKVDESIFLLVIAFLFCLFIPSVHAGAASGTCEAIGYAVFVNNGTGGVGAQYGADNSPAFVPRGTEILVDLNITWTAQLKQHDLEIRWRAQGGSFASVNVAGTNNGSAFEYWDSSIYTAQTLNSAPPAHWASTFERWTHDIRWLGFGGTIPSSKPNTNEHWAMVKTPNVSGTYELELYDWEGSRGCTITQQALVVVNAAPTISNITLSKSVIKGGTQMIIYANSTSNGVNDTDLSSVTIYCSNATSSPSASNYTCTSTDATYPYDLTCAYNVKVANANETVFCRVYDGVGYSINNVNATYLIDSNPPSLYIISVAADTTPAYFDIVNDDVTAVNVSGEANMSCRWAATDVSYSSMVFPCTVIGTNALCNLTGFAQGSFTRYISCQDNLTNENNATNNLNVDFTLDYTAPTTSDNSNTNFQLPPYIITLTEFDNTGGDPASYYCTDVTGTCVPTIPLDNGGTVTFTTLNRGRNYFRYYSVDYAGNTQATQNKSININQLPNLTSASDNASVIKGGTIVNVSTVSFDADSGQGITLFVCNSTSATSSGCAAKQYCNQSGTTNLSCIFASEIDTTVHNWYAFIFDDLGEAATGNPKTGSYTTDSSGPVITIISPVNTSYPSVNVTAGISTSEASLWAGYSLDEVANVSMTNVSSTSFTASLTNLAYGQHNITFYANDSYGNYGASSIRYFTIETPVDVTAPSLTFVSPSNLSYTNPSVTYVNVSSDEALVWAGYRLNGGSLTNLSNVSITLWYVNLTSLSQETNYTLVVYGNDSSGNQGNRTVVFYSDSLAPRYSAVNASPNPTNTSVAVNCSVYWNDTFALNNVLIGENSSGVFENHTISLTSKGTASYLIVGNKLANKGTYSCQFYASDAAGNMNLTSITFTVNDVTVPVITPTSPSNGAVYNQENITLSLVSNEALSWAGYSLNGSANVSMGNISATNWNATLSGLINGQSYYLVFYGNDSSGNFGASTSIGFSVNTGVGDTTPPVLTSTLTNASYKTSLPVLFNVSSNENLNWSGYTLNGGSLTNLTNISEVLWNGTLETLVPGSTNTLIVYGNDLSNNSGNLTTIFYFDNKSPQFSLVSATSINETQNVNCTAYVNDSFSFSNVKISENATSPGNFLNHTIDLTSEGYANYTIFNVVKGNYSCIFYATDVAGNMNYTSTTFIVSDVTAPGLTINSPIAQNYSTSSILFSLTTSEVASSAKYSLDGGVTNVSLSGSGVSWSKISTVADGSYNVTFYANDSSGNEGTATVAIIVDTTVNDNVAPIITVWSPLNGSYDFDGSVLLNITADESLSWAGYRNNSGILFDLENVSLINWNKTVDFNEGIYTIVFYANDTRTAPKNQGNRSVTIYVDLNSPSVNSFVCDSIVNDSMNLTCNASVSDAIGLDYAILSYNFSGSFVNSSNLSLSGISDTLNYLFTEGNYTPGDYAVKIYLFDLSGQMNDSLIDYVQVLDDYAPGISNVLYFPNTSALLDPNINVTINASILEDYQIDSVSVYYKNISDSGWTSTVMTNTSLTAYNVTLEFGAGNWTFYINATDAQGNTNISSNYSFEVADDISQNITTNISSVSSFTYAQRASANELGYLILNTTSDTTLNYNVTITSSDAILSRFNLNNTLNQTEKYTATSRDVLYIPIYVNLTDLTAALYGYNISIVSEAGTELIERNLNVQVAEGPYLSVSINTYSSRVTRGETGVEYSATVTNLGTSDAQDVYLNWSLPSGFSISTGSLSRNLATLAIGVSGSNTISLNVASSITDPNLTVYASASSSNSDSVNVSKVVTISDPLTITETVIIPGTGGAGGSGGGAAVGGGKAEVYSKTIEVIRGNKTSFTIDFGNKYVNKTLENVSIDLTGYPIQYLKITPSSFIQVSYGENRSFEVILTAPSYKSYEEYTLQAVIKGFLISANNRESYVETQNIKLIIQEISYEESFIQLNFAEDAIKEMEEKGYNILEMQQVYSLAKQRLESDRHNQESYDLSAKVIGIKKTAFEAKGLITLIRQILQNPQDINLLTGNVVKSDTTQNAIFYSSSIEDVLTMADAAFERGDYTAALERAQKAELLLRLEQKGNLFIFIYLYWPQLLFSLVIILLVSKIVYSQYSKRKISVQIKDYDVEEDNIHKLISDNQKNYYSGKISSSDYHSRLSQYNNRLAILRKSRISLRNKRIKTLAPEDFDKELNSEKKEVEKEIIKIQEDFYRAKKIPESNYQAGFELLNNRLAEIEDERIVVDIKTEKNKINAENKLFSFFGKRKERKEQELKRKIDELLKSKEVSK